MSSLAPTMSPGLANTKALKCDWEQKVPSLCVYPGALKPSWFRKPRLHCLREPRLETKLMKTVEGREPSGFSLWKSPCSVFGDWKCCQIGSRTLWAPHTFDEKLKLVRKSWQACSLWPNSVFFPASLLSDFVRSVNFCVFVCACVRVCVRACVCVYESKREREWQRWRVKEQTVLVYAPAPVCVLGEQSSDELPCHGRGLRTPQPVRFCWCCVG